MRRTRRPVGLSTKVALSLDEISSLRNPPRRRIADTSSVEVTHNFDIRPASDAIAADFSIEQESLEILFRSNPGGPAKSLASFKRTAKGEISATALKGSDLPDAVSSLALYDDEFDLLSKLEDKVDTTTLLINYVGFHPVIYQFRQVLSAIRIYQISPLELRRPGVPTPNPSLERFGENLPGLVDYFRKRAKPAWENILDAMQQIVPDLDDIDTEFSVDRRLALQFKESGVGRAWNANEISDGTIQSLALFCALYDPRSSLVFIEEPENSVHPWIVRVFLDACRKASSEGKQIIVTTHSPALLQQARPSEVKIIWRKGGYSNIAPLVDLDPDLEKLWDQGSSDVFEVLDSGAIRESVPEGNA